MVEITNTGVIGKIQEALGLRGKAIVSSRNSIYPVVIVNAENQPIPQKPPMIPTSGNASIILMSNPRTAGSYVPYTCPAGKVAFIVCTTLINNAAISTSAVIQNVESTELYRLADITTVGNMFFMPSVPVKLVAGDHIDHVVSATGSAILCIYGWEENA